MRLLLDTHAMLWFMEEHSSLSRAAYSAIESPDIEVFVSHASALEIAIKLSLGKLDLKFPFERLFPTAVLENGFEVLALDFAHYHRLLELPHHHRDPFDRLLIAQAKVEGMNIVTRDPHFAAYGVPILW